MNKSAITKNIKSLRQDRNMTQLELSEKSGLTRMSIMNYESGRRFPSTLSLLALAKALGVAMEDIICGAFGQECLK